MSFKSFFQSQVSNDEYVDKKKLQFRLEALYIIIALLAINGLVGILTGNFSGHVLLSIGIVVFFCTYLLLRFTFNGLDHPDVASKNMYKTKRREVLVYTVISAVIFFMINLGYKLFFKSHSSWIDIIGVSIIFLVIFGIWNYISVKKSYRKNKEIFDDK